MDCRTALLTILDQVDYTNGACTPFEMVGAVLPKEVIALARKAIAEDVAPQVDLHFLCVLAVEKMVSEGIDKHESFISSEDDITFGLKENGKIPKVTIEWVESTANQ